MEMRLDNNVEKEREEDVSVGNRDIIQEFKSMYSIGL